MKLTVITATKPATLSKRFELVSGKLVRHPGGALVEGKADQRTVSVSDLRALLSSLTPSQALTFGVSAHEKARLVTQDALSKTRSGNGSMPTIARDREHFSWPEGAGYMMIDHDPAGGAPMSKEELLGALYQVCPGLESSPHVWAASASSGIYRADTGEELRGVMGQRLYIPVSHAGDIPRAGGVLFARLFLAGFGRFEVSKSGQMLERSIIDAAVWQPERLDFAGGARCGAGLEQRRPAPEAFNPDAPLLDTGTLADLTADERKRLADIKAELRIAKEPEARAQRERWIEERVTQALKGTGKKQTREHLRDVYRRAVEQGRLLADFELHSEKHGAVTVGQVLDNPDRFHNTRFADPLEPEYGNDRRIAFVSLRTAGRPYIYSHAHGGARYALHRAVQTIQIQPGELPRIAERTLELMRLDGCVYDHGKLMTRITGGCSYAVTSEWLAYYLGGLVAFQKYNGRSKKNEPADCPERLSRIILGMAGHWGLPELQSLVTIPTITPEGRVIQEDGFDLETGFYLHFQCQEDWLPVPDTPTEAQVKAAVQAPFRPFRDFPFETGVDRGVCLAAALTAVAQANIALKPGVAIDAPAPGSGKTKLAECFSILAGGIGAVNPPPETEKEMEHVLVQQILDCAPVLILDNVNRILSSASLCAYMTGITYRGRVLGAQLYVAGRPGMVVITGNALTTAEDMNRRFLRLRIDPQCEKPQERTFDIDPPAYVREHRLKLVHAALTILRASVLSDFPANEKRLGSYEQWSDFVRRAVLWVGAKGWLEVGDPIKSIDENLKNDPNTEKLGRLLNAWLERFGEDGATVPNAQKQALKDDDFRQILLEVAKKDGAIDSRRLGEFIRRRVARIVDGLRFRGGEKRQGYAVWVAERAAKKRESEQSRDSHLYTSRENASDIFPNVLCADFSDSRDSHTEELKRAGWEAF